MAIKDLLQNMHDDREDKKRQQAELEEKNKKDLKEFLEKANQHMRDVIRPKVAQLIADFNPSTKISSATPTEELSRITYESDAVSSAFTVIVKKMQTVKKVMQVNIVPNGLHRKLTVSIRKATIKTSHGASVSRPDVKESTEYFLIHQLTAEKLEEYVEQNFISFIEN